jgi:hypothetical protein
MKSVLRLSSCVVRKTSRWLFGVHTQKPVQLAPVLLPATDGVRLRTVLGTSILLTRMADDTPLTMSGRKSPLSG